MATTDPKKRIKKGYQVSIRGDLYDRVRAFADERGVSITSVVEPLIVRAIGAPAAA